MAEPQVSKIGTKMVRCLDCIHYRDGCQEGCDFDELCSGEFPEEYQDIKQKYFYREK